MVHAVVESASRGVHEDDSHVSEGFPRDYWVQELIHGLGHADERKLRQGKGDHERLRDHEKSAKEWSPKSDGCFKALGKHGIQCQW